MLHSLSHIVRLVAVLAAATLLLSAIGFGQLQPTPSRIGPPVADGGNAAASGGALPPEIMELRRATKPCTTWIRHRDGEIRRDTQAGAASPGRRPLSGYHPLARASQQDPPVTERTLRLGVGFYADVDKAKEGSEGDAVDADVDRAFREKMAQAKTKALALVARNKNDADALYFLGAYYGVMAVA